MVIPPPPARSNMDYKEQLLKHLSDSVSDGTGAKVQIVDDSGNPIAVKTVDGVLRLCVDTEFPDIVLSPGQVVVNVQDKEEVSGQETTTPLLANTTFTPAGWVNVARYARITGACFAGHSANKNANGTLIIQHSKDGVNIDKESPINVPDAYDPTNPNGFTDAQGTFHPNGVAFSIEAPTGYVRVVYVNGPNAQNQMRLSVWKRSLT